MFDRDRFDTSVSGRRSGGELRLVLRVGDGETATFHCNPAAEPFTGRCRLIEGGMRFAGALDFTMTAPGSSGSATGRFYGTGDHRSARGTVLVGRAG